MAGQFNSPFRCYNFSFVGISGGSKAVHLLACEFNQKRYEKTIVYTMIVGMLIKFLLILLQNKIKTPDVEYIDR